MTKPEESMDELSLDQLVASARKRASVDQQAGHGATGETLRKGIVAYHTEQYQKFYSEGVSERQIWMLSLFVKNINGIYAKSALATLFFFVAAHFVLFPKKADNQFELVATNGYGVEEVVVRSIDGGRKITIKSSEPKNDAFEFFEQLKVDGIKSALSTNGHVYVISFDVQVDVVWGEQLKRKWPALNGIEVGQVVVIFE